MIKFTGGTPLAMAALKLGYLSHIGSWLESSVAMVPEEDADTFEELLRERRHNILPG